MGQSFRVRRNVVHLTILDVCLLITWNESHEEVQHVACAYLIVNLSCQRSYGESCQAFCLSHPPCVPETSPRNVFAVVHMPSWCLCVHSAESFRGTTLEVWFAQGPALWWEICHSDWKSDTCEFTSQKRGSSVNRASVWSVTNSLLPNGVPNTFIQSNSRTSSPNVLNVIRKGATSIPNSKNEKKWKKKISKKKKVKKKNWKNEKKERKKRKKKNEEKKMKNMGKNEKN